MRRQPTKPCVPRQKGVALVLTLLAISMLVVVVVGFTSVTRLEQIAARNSTYQTAAQQMAQLATGEAMQRLSEAVTAGVAAGMFATQPGAIHPQGADSQSLYSTNGTSTNINSFTTNGFVTGNPADNITIRATDVIGENDQIIGRTGFYISDESAKLPVNRAAPQRTSLNAAPPRPFSIKGVDTNLPASAVVAFSNVLAASQTNPSSISNWTFFFTPEQLAAAVTNIGPIRARRLTVATETNAALEQRMPWGTPKIRINQLPLVDTSVETLATALSAPQLTTVFGGHFGDKYGEDGVRQLAANMLQLRSDHWRTNTMFQGQDPVLGSSSLGGAVLAPPVGVAKKTNGIPQAFLGYTPFPMISEMDVSFVYGWENAPPNDFMTIRVILTCVLTNPFPVRFPGGGELYAQIDKASFAMDYNGVGPFWRGPDGSIQSPAAPHNDLNYDNPWGSAQQVADWNLDPPSGARVVALPAIGPRGSEALSVYFDMAFLDQNPDARIAQAYIILDQVKLLAESGNPQSIRDWCSGNDFFNAMSAGGGSPAQFAIPNVLGVAGLNFPARRFDARGPLPLVAPPPPQKLVRIDPRLRPGLDASEVYQAQPPGRAWSLVAAAALPPGPSAFLEAEIPADPAFAEDVPNAVFNTNNPPVMTLSSGNYSSAADLGKVFTGAPWRALRMQPQPPVEAEAEHIPDWALLDMLEFTSGASPLGSVNPNFRFASAGATVAGFGSGLRSQLDVLTNNIASRALVDPLSSNVPPTANAITASGFTTNQTGINAILSAISRPEATNSWSTNSVWAGRRAALGFPTNVILLPSELAEIRGVADYISVEANPNRFKENEYRLGALFPGLRTRGRFFTIYAVGQALELGGSNAVATALLETLVEVDDSTTPVSIRTIYQRPPAN